MRDNMKETLDKIDLAKTDKLITEYRNFIREKKLKEIKGSKYSNSLETFISNLQQYFSYRGQLVNYNDGEVIDRNLKTYINRTLRDLRDLNKKYRFFEDFCNVNSINFDANESNITVEESSQILEDNDIQEQKSNSSLLASLFSKFNQKKQNEDDKEEKESRKKPNFEIIPDEEDPDVISKENEKIEKVKNILREHTILCVEFMQFLEDKTLGPILKKYINSAIQIDPKFSFSLINKISFYNALKKYFDDSCKSIYFKDILYDNFDIESKYDDLLGNIIVKKGNENAKKILSNIIEKYYEKDNESGKYCVRTSIKSNKPIRTGFDDEVDRSISETLSSDGAPKEEDEVINDGKNDNKNDNKSKKKNRVKVKGERKPKDKSKLIKRLIAASLAIVTFVATGSVISRLFNKNDISQSSDSSISVASSVDSTSKEESKDQGNKTLNNVKEVSNDTKKEENSKVESSSNEVKETSKVESSSGEVKETSKVENSNTKTEEDSKVDNSNTKKEDTSKTDKKEDKKENVTDSRADSVSKSDSYINIGDKVTLKDDIIYTDVYSTTDRNNGAPAYFDNNMERTVSSILLTNGQDKYYSINKDEVDKKINEGWVTTSAVISNNGGIEGAEPISNLVEVTKNISNDTASESVDNKQKDDTSKKIEESSEKVSNSSDNTKKENDNKENVTDSDTLDNIKGKISKIMDEKKDDKDISDSISNNVRKIMAEKASIGDKVTIDKDVIYKDIYSASIKENGLPAYHDNNKVRSISSVLLTKDGLNRYSSNQEEINNLRKQGWVVKAVLIANENGLEGFEPIDNLNEVNDNSVGGRHL